MDLVGPAAGNALDLLVQIHLRPGEARGEPLGERGLARAAQADQRDAVQAVVARLGFAEQLRERDARRFELRGRSAVQQVADQQPVGRVGGLVAQQLGQRAVERQGDLAQDQDRRVAMPGFEVGEVALGDIRGLRQHLARHAAPRAQPPHALAEGLLQGVGHLGRLGARVHRALA